MNSTPTTLFDRIEPLALLVTTKTCFTKYTMDFDFFNAACFSATLSKCLGLGIILGSILVKLPQILKIYQNKSGKGISLVSVSLDLTAITIYAAYSYRKAFPFSAWGDASFLAIQTVIIALLVLIYENSIFAALFYICGYLAVTVAMLNEQMLSISALWSLQGCNIFIVLSGKLAQAYTNYVNGHTGHLSAVTLILLFAGSLARIFTSIQETGDLIVILTYVSSTFANAIIVWQLWYYWNITTAKMKEE